MAYTVKLRDFHAGQSNIIQNRAKLTVIRCGRRFGKTTAFEDMACNFGLQSKHVGFFAPDYKKMLPSFKRVRRTLKDVIASASQTDGIIELITGGSIEFWTLNDEDAGRSRKYHEVLIDEASLVKKGMQAIWEQAISPTLLDYNGNAMMAGTPKGIDEENYFYKACTDKTLGWKEFHAPTASNPTLNQEAVAALRHKVAPLVYQQEYLAEFVDWSGSAFFSLERLLDNGNAVDYPKYCNYVFATLDTAVKTGSNNDGTAITYWAYSSLVGHKLTILDYDKVQIEGSLLESWLPSVYKRLDELSAQCGARQGSIGLMIEDKASGSILIQQAKRRGWVAHAIDSKLTAVGKDERAISVSGYVHQGLVKISTFAYNKVINYKGILRNHLITEVCGFRIGVKDQQDDLLDTFCYGVALALGNDDGF